MQRPKNRRRAAALVITVGLLAVLAVIGFGFAVFARLQHDTSHAYRAASQIDLLSMAAFHYATREIRYGRNNVPGQPGEGDPLRDEHWSSDYPYHHVGALHEPTDSPIAPWYIDPALASGLYRDYNNRDNPDDIWRYCYARNNSYALVHDVLGDRVAVSFVTVQDSAGKLNINDDYEDTRLKTILVELLDQLEITTTVEQPTAENPIPTLTTGQIADNIIGYRDAPAPGGAGGAFTTLEQLRNVQGITERRFDVLKHYLTIYSWPHDPPSVEGFTYYTVRPDSQDAAFRTLAANDEKRSPININTAPREVLVAVLSNVKAASMGSTLGATKAGDIADWIIRRRDPENRYHWLGESGAWGNWLNWTKNNTNYTNSIRKREISCWRHYPVGPFDSWNEFIDFLYSCTDSDSDDPFYVNGLTKEEAEAIIAAVCPNSFASMVPRNTWTMGYCRMKKDTQVVQELREATTGQVPSIIGKNQLGAQTEGYGDVNEFCFSSMGRYEIASRTFAFVKADFGRVTADSPYTLVDDSKSWGTAPAQWRGYSALIYDGKGKGQLRGVVANSANTLTVAKWSTRLQNVDGTDDNRSRYYILGPGPVLDCVGGGARNIDVPSENPHFLADPGATWEDDEWNGYRVVVYRASTVTETGPGGVTIDVENIDQGTVQERIIIDTDGARKRLVLSPELDLDIPPGATDHWSYIILGSDGTAAHDAAIKAYDVVRHTSLKDFTDWDGSIAKLPTGCDKVAVGPQPIGGGFANLLKPSGTPPYNPRAADGWIAVAKRKVENASYFVHNFTASDLKPDSTTKGDLKEGTSAAELVRDVFAAPGGRLFPDGLHLRHGSGHWLGYSTTGLSAGGSSSLVSNERHEGGFVSVWIRLDRDFFTGGGQRTLIRIRGESDQEDIKLVYDNADSKIKLIVNANADRDYEEPVNAQTITYQKGTYNFSDPSHSDIGDTGKKWKAGQWHHVAFAWYECADEDGKNDDPNYDDDTKAETDWRDDEAEPSDKILDASPQVYGRVRLWVDGKSTDVDSCPKKCKVNAFNLWPVGGGTGDDHTSLQIGDSTTSLGATIDGIFARTHADKTLGMSPTIGTRYEGSAGSNDYVTYRSRAIDLPSGLGDLYLGTVAWTGFMPWIKDAERNWHSGARGDYPIYVTVTLGSTSKPVPQNGVNKEPVLGGGGPLRSVTDYTIHSTSSTMHYEVKMLSYHGDPDGDAEKNQRFERHWQTPVFEDITITYLGPVVFFHWR